MSAAFPGPVAPREFLELLMTSDNALSDASSLDKPGGKIPRHLMVVSRPTTHKDAPPRSELVRGTYESVELIREIPVEGQDPELNPIEWVMVTRSDPGGGIPRFMVERGTPSSVVADTAKFLDWACQQPDVVADDHRLTRKKTFDEHNPTSHDEVSERHRQSISEMKAKAPIVEGTNGNDPATEEAIENTEATNVIATSEPAPTSTESSGIISSTINYVETAAAAYLPSFGATNESVAEQGKGEATDSEPLSRTSTTDSFRSADDGTSDATDSPVSSRIISNKSDESLSANRPRTDTVTSSMTSPTPSTINLASSTPSLAASLIAGEIQPNNNHEKEILKLHRKTLQLDETVAKARQTDDEKTAQLNELAKSTTETSQHDQSAHQKAREKHINDTQKRQEKYTREKEKLAEKIQNEERKAEEKKRKDFEKSEVNRMKKERDEARQQRKKAELEVDQLKKEIETLRKEVVALRAQLPDTSDDV